MAFDVEKIRKDFPILEQRVNNKPLVYLDSAATSQRPLCVVDKMSEYYLECNANVHRGVHFLSNKATDANEEARRRIQRFIGAASEKEVIFTRGTTESINLVAYSFGEAFIQAGDEIVVSEMEHHANIVPWQMLCERKGAILKVIPFTDAGELEMDVFDRLLTERVKLVAVAYVPNVLGTVNPIQEIIKKAHAVGAKVLVDGAQSVSHMPTDVRAWDCDFFVFSAHKIYGPTGVGILYGKEALLEQMPPWQGGGEMIKEVRFEKTIYNELPFKFEAGTPDFIGIIGFGEAIRYVEEIGLKNIAAYENELLAYAMECLRAIPQIRLFGEARQKASVTAFLLGDVHPFDTGTLLDQMGIAVRTGQLCAEPTMQHYGVAGMVRASWAMYNTKAEVDALCSGLEKIQKLF